MHARRIHTNDIHADQNALRFAIPCEITASSEMQRVLELRGMDKDVQNRKR